MAIPRLLYTNQVQASGAVLTASSEATAFPASNLLDQLRSQVWRSGAGWTIVPGVNDALLFSTADGNRHGYVAPGTYASGAALATAVQTALNASGYGKTAFGPNVRLWCRADSVTLDATGLVSGMNDLSGNGNALSQSTVGFRPLWVPKAIDNRPGMYCDGTIIKGFNSTALMSSLLGANGVGTIFIVFRLDSDDTAGSSLFLAGSGGALMYHWWSGGGNFEATAYDTSAKGATKVVGSVPATLYCSIWEYDQVNIQSYLGNANSAAGANTAMTGALHSNIMTSTFSFGLHGGQPIKGYLFEIMLFNKALAEFERQGVMNYFRARYPSLTDASTAFAFPTTLATTYDATSKKFTISRSSGSGNIALLGGSGVPAEDRANLVFPDMGYTAGVDKSGASSFASDNAVYQSRQWLKVDLGSAAALTAAIVLDHNAGAGGTFTLEANNLDLFTAPAFSQVLSGDATLRMAFFAAQSYRYWRLMINDVSNAAGYVELGVWYVGNWASPSLCHSESFMETLEELSAIGYGTHGSHMTDERPQRRNWSLLWSQVPAADRAVLETLVITKKAGQNFFIQFDPASIATVYYVMRRENATFGLATPFPYWDVALALAESLD